MARVKDEALFSLLRDYLTIYLLNQRKSSPNTVKAYRSAWNQFLKYLAAENKVRIIEVSFEMINKDSVSGYLTWLSEKKDMKWLDNFSIAASMLCGMAAAALIG